MAHLPCSRHLGTYIIKKPRIGISELNSKVLYQSDKKAKIKLVQF